MSKSDDTIVEILKIVGDRRHSAEHKRQADIAKRVAKRCVLTEIEELRFLVLFREMSENQRHNLEIEMRTRVKQHRIELSKRVLGLRKEQS